MEYKTIPGFGIYRISEYGDIECYLENEVQFKVESLESKTSKGVYLVVNILNNNLHKIWRGVHQLVCMSFNGMPPADEYQYDVNHIDGNKLNNHYTNLEWLKHSDNTLHAIKNGLRNDNVSVIMKNVITKENFTFYSIYELARYLNVSRESIYALIGRHKVEPFENKFIFEINPESFGKVLRVNSKPLFLYDYSEKTWTKTNSVGLVSVLTGIKNGYINYMLIDNEYFNVAGYFITKFEDRKEYIDKTITKNDALNLRKEYYAKHRIFSVEKRNNIITHIYNK